MKNNLSILYLIIFSIVLIQALSCTPYLDYELVEKPTEEEYYFVTKVSDGDTFWVQKRDRTDIKIRLIGVDAPESVNAFNLKKEYYGVEAKDFLTDLILKQYVQLEFDIDSLDIYGRTLAYAYLVDGQFINNVLVVKGYARMMTVPPNIKYREIFASSEAYAKGKNIGLWAER